MSKRSLHVEEESTITVLPHELIVIILKFIADSDRYFDVGLMLWTCRDYLSMASHVAIKVGLLMSGVLKRIERQRPCNKWLGRYTSSDYDHLLGSLNAKLNEIFMTRPYEETPRTGGYILARKTDKAYNLNFVRLIDHVLLFENMSHYEYNVKPSIEKLSVGSTLLSHVYYRNLQTQMISRLIDNTEICGHRLFVIDGLFSKSLIKTLISTRLTSLSTVESSVVKASLELEPRLKESVDVLFDVWGVDIKQLLVKPCVDHNEADLVFVDEKKNKCYTLNSCPFAYLKNPNIHRFVCLKKDFDYIRILMALKEDYDAHHDQLYSYINS